MGHKRGAPLGHHPSRDLDIEFDWLYGECGDRFNTISRIDFISRMFHRHIILYTPECIHPRKKLSFLVLLFYFSVKEFNYSCNRLRQMF